MLIEKPKKLSSSIDINCYCCEHEKAAYRCRFKMEELQVQVCLCEVCMHLDTGYLFENTVGLSYQDSLTNLKHPDPY